MVATPLQATQAPSPPPTPAPPGPSAVVAPTSPTGLILAVPTTQVQVDALRAQRRELSDQLTSAANRREGLAKDLAGAPESSRPGIQARIDLLDRRILQIEADIASTGELISRSPVLSRSAASTFQSPTGRNFNVDLTAVAVVFTIFVLAPIAFTIARNIWRRGSHPRADLQLERENSERLVRLESSIDTIAIEMERVSEGQRFVTKLLAESRAAEKVRQLE